LVWSLLLGRDVWATEGPVEQTAPLVQAHPQLTPFGYQLSAEKEQALAGRRHALKLRRLGELHTRRDAAQAAGDVALVELLAAVIERVKAGPVNSPSSNPWASEHVAHLRAANQWRRYGAKLHEPYVVEEFDKHALRVAQLRRMQEVVRTSLPSTERDTWLNDIDTTIEMEATRHVERLERWLQPLEGNAL
jgi:hypothetical protein